MKYILPILILSALPLVACGGDIDDSQSAANNQLEAADNVMWNDLANISLENEASVAPPAAADAKTESEARPSAKSTGSAPKPDSRQAAPARKADPAPEAAPTPEPSSPPQEDCAPEHRAAGHC